MPCSFVPGGSSCTLCLALFKILSSPATHLYPTRARIPVVAHPQQPLSVPSQHSCTGCPTRACWQRVFAGKRLVRALPLCCTSAPSARRSHLSLCPTLKPLLSSSPYLLPQHACSINTFSLFVAGKHFMGIHAHCLTGGGRRHGSISACLHTAGHCLLLTYIARHLCLRCLRALHQPLHFCGAHTPPYPSDTGQTSLCLVTHAFALCPLYTHGYLALRAALTPFTPRAALRLCSGIFARLAATLRGAPLPAALPLLPTYLLLLPATYTIPEPSLTCLPACLPAYILCRLTFPPVVWDRRVHLSHSILCPSLLWGSPYYTRLQHNTTCTHYFPFSTTSTYLQGQ